jgi:Proline dehydrogenase
MVMVWLLVPALSEAHAITHCAIAQVLERERASQMGTPSPIHDTIEDTHLNYNRFVRQTTSPLPSHTGACPFARMNVLRLS